jgi:catechol 2,3-dioxygenase-like lactoylglutathione lyase family enzyme
MTAPPIESLDHLVLTVEDLEATRHFYVDGLGMALVRFGENDGRLALRFGRQKLNLHQRGREFEPKAMRPTPGSADLCFLTAQPVETLKAELEAKGFAVIEGPVARSGAIGPLRSIYLRDPDGNLIELANQLSDGEPKHAG